MKKFVSAWHAGQDLSKTVEFFPIHWRTFIGSYEHKCSFISFHLYTELDKSKTRWMNAMSVLWSRSLNQYNNLRCNTNNPMTKQMWNFFRPLWCFSAICTQCRKKLDNKTNEVAPEPSASFESEETDVLFSVETETSSCLVSEVYVFVVKQ